VNQPATVLRPNAVVTPAFWPERREFIMTGSQPCPRCGRELPDDAPSGLCPACLLGAALAGPGETEDREPASGAETVSDSGRTVPDVVRAEDTSGSSPGETLEFRTRDPGSAGDPAVPATIRYFGDYALKRLLGRGGMGEVWLAHQTSLNDRPVAVKTVRAGSFAHPEDLARFRNEAEAIAALDHPNLVEIYEVGEHEGQPYYSMKLYSGGSLDVRLSQFLDDPRRSASLVAAVARAVHHAHQRGILHRDLKPANVLLDERGEPHVTDFGLAKRLDDDSSLTVSGAVMGTPAFMAPEQTTGRKGTVTTVSDVYGLGAILYSTLTGRPPFGGDSVVDTLQAVREQTPEPPSRRNGRLPRDIEVICLKCLEKDPRRRYDSADLMAGDLERFVSGKPIEARPVGAATRAWMWCRRNPAVAGLTATVAGLVLTVAVVSAVSALRLRWALDDSRRATANANAKLWESLLSGAEARRMSRQPGQSFGSLRAIGQALKLPTPPGHSRDELRTEAIAALCLPDVELEKKWDASMINGAGIAFDDAFRRYALVDERGDVSVRRVESDAELFRLPSLGQIPDYHGLLFSPDGRYLQHRSNGPRSRLWRLDGPQPVVVLDADFTKMTFRPDSAECAARFRDGSVRLYDPETGRELRRFTSGLPDDAGMAWNPRQSRLLLMSRTAVRVIDAETGKTFFEKKFVGALSGAAWHPDGNVLAVGDRNTDYAIRFWDTRTGKQVGPPLVGHSQNGPMLEFNHAGDRLISTDWSGQFRLWDTHPARQLLAESAGSYLLQFQSDDTRLACDRRLFRLRNGREFRTVLDHQGAKPRIYHAKSRPCFDASGRLLAVRSESGVLLVDVARGEETALLPLPGQGPNRFDAADGSLWTAGRSGLLRWPIAADPTAGGAIHVGPPEQLIPNLPTDDCASSSDGGLVVVSADAKGAYAWRHDRKRFQTLGPQHDVRSSAVSPDGRWIATGSHSTSPSSGVKVWSADSGEQVADRPIGAICRVGFSPDNRWLITTGGGHFRLWKVGTWREGPDLGESAHNNNFAFTANGQLLALGEAAIGVVRLVVPDTGREVARLVAPEPSRLAPVAFSPDGAQLATVGLESGAVHLFDLRAIREGLAELGLDWDATPLPPPSPAAGDPRSPGAVALLAVRIEAAPRVVASVSENLTAPTPASVTTLLNDLRSAGNSLLANELTREIEQARAEVARAQKSSPIRPGHVIVGRLVGEGLNDASQVIAQMAIHREGHFVAAVGASGRPVGFRKQGYLPAEVTPAGEPGSVEDVGEVRLQPTPEAMRAAVKAKLTVEGAASTTGATARLMLQMGPTNTPSGGYVPRVTDSRNVTVADSGEFTVPDLSPLAYSIRFEAPGAVGQFRSASPKPGETLDLGTIRLEKPRRVTVSYREAPSPPFAAVTQQQTVLGGGLFRAGTAEGSAYDLRFDQRDRTIHFGVGYGPCMLADLGVGKLDDFLQVDATTARFNFPTHVAAQPGHVYLLDQKFFKHWVLFQFEFDQEAPQ
jgi:WD40 repeat protein